MRILHQQTYQYGFFHALRLIECAYPEKPLIGQSKRPGDDPVRFGQEVSLAFEASTLSRFVPGNDGRPARLNQLFSVCLGRMGRCRCTLPNMSGSANTIIMTIPWLDSPIFSTTG
nr:type VI secretion system baseplate subunit TssG [Methylomarinum sp. Ch1-1]MDP4520092.1 type VI secretion system baseplate subunit TssG [Methylomarinum sp. Ch1-1]